MASAPSQIAVKRRRSDAPLPFLNLEERRTKLERLNIQYRLEGAESKQHVPAPQASLINTAPRQFQLASQGTRKRGAEAAGLLPTFEERTDETRKRVRRDGSQLSNGAEQTHGDLASNGHTPFKRPGTRTLRSDAPKPRPAPTTPVQLPASDVTDALHKFALEEAAYDEEQARQLEQDKPKVIVQPKRPIRRLKDRVPQPAPPQNNNDMDTEMSDDDEYVYDIYVRLEQSKAITADSEDPASQSIGYLIITEEDEPLWEQYLEEEDTDKEFDTDEDDENAEDYYGADYPEDEVASDDEHGEGAYGYRHGASDDEQYGSDDDAFSDQEEAMRNPWKKAPWMRTPKQVSDEDNDTD